MKLAVGAVFDIAMEFVADSAALIKTFVLNEKLTVGFAGEPAAEMTSTATEPSLPMEVGCSG